MAQDLAAEQERAREYGSRSSCRPKGAEKAIPAAYSTCQSSEAIAQV